MRRRATYRRMPEVTRSMARNLDSIKGLVRRLDRQLQYVESHEKAYNALLNSERIHPLVGLDARGDPVFQEMAEEVPA